MGIKMFGNEITQVYFQGKEIKAAYFQGKKIFPSPNYYYIGVCNVASNYFEPVEIVLMNNRYIKFIMDNGNWDFLCDNNPNATIDNPCVCYHEDGSINSNFSIFWSQTAGCWILRINSLGELDEKAFRYLARDMEMARALPTCNIANLIL